VLDPVRDDAERKRFGVGSCLLFGCAIGEYGGQCGNLADPATVIFACRFDPKHGPFPSELCERELHGRDLERARRIERQTLTLARLKRVHSLRFPDFPLASEMLSR
jgi:hypothetical protein